MYFADGSAVNFSGDPKRDHFGGTSRKAVVIIPNEDIANEMVENGIHVSRTKPHAEEDEDTYTPTYYVNITAKYDSERPPVVYLVAGNADPVLLDESTIGQIDKAYVTKVDAVVSVWQSKKTGKKSLFIRTMYVTIDDGSYNMDPFAAKYGRQ